VSLALVAILNAVTQSICVQTPLTPVLIEVCVVARTGETSCIDARPIELDESRQVYSVPIPVAGFFAGWDAVARYLDRSLSVTGDGPMKQRRTRSTRLRAPRFHGGCS
jgi:hypothetical protein